MLRHTLKRFDVPAAIRWMVLAVWMIVFLTYLLQTEAAPILSTGIPPGPPSLGRDILFTLVHLLAYTMTTFLWAWALIAILPLRRTLIATFVIVLSLSFFTELGQTLTPGRLFQLIDLAANAGGLMLGLIGFGFLYTWYEQNLI